MINTITISNYVSKHRFQLLMLVGLSVAYAVAQALGNEVSALPLLAVGAMDDFAEVFAGKTLRRFFNTAVTPAITNADYEGEIKKAGDRVDILQFPGDMPLNDYESGVDMDTQRIFDMEDQLVVEKRKYYNFPIDRLEDLFTYVDDADNALIESANKTLERTVDSYVLEQVQYAKAGSWIGIDMRVTGSSRDTEASIATTATGGTVTIDVGTVNGDGTVEHGDGTLDYGGFTAADIGKPFRLTSGASWATGWYRITGVTSSVVATLENWDSATEALDIPQGDVLREMYGAFEFTGGEINGDGKPTTEGGWGWELQAARSTTLTSGLIYEQSVLLGEKLDENEVPDTDRHVTVPSGVKSMLQNAAELQPAVSMAYEGVVINGRVGKVAGLDIHVAVGTRVTTRLEHSTSTGQGSSTVTVAGTRASQILANHRSMITFAFKWSESRTVEAENQFATKYQGLNLFGAKVPGIRRRNGALLFGKI